MRLIRIIFYYPTLLNEKPKSASEIRPIKMINAFRNLGYSIEIISGYSKKRKEGLKLLEKEICAEINYGFVYVEQDFTNFFR